MKLLWFLGVILITESSASVSEIVPESKKKCSCQKVNKS